MTLIPVLTDISVIDSHIGEMVECRYAWNEFCLPCAARYSQINPERHHRGISIAEACSSWREYVCYQCHKPLWSRGPATVHDMEEKQAA